MTYFRQVKTLPAPPITAISFYKTFVALESKRKNLTLLTVKHSTGGQRELCTSSLNYWSNDQLDDWSKDI